MGRPSIALFLDWLQGILRTSLTDLIASQKKKNTNNTSRKVTSPKKLHSEKKDDPEKVKTMQIEKSNKTREEDLKDKIVEVATEVKEFKKEMSEWCQEHD